MGQNLSKTVRLEEKHPSALCVQYAILNARDKCWHIWQKELGTFYKVSSPFFRGLTRFSDLCLPVMAAV